MGYSPWGHKESDATERLHWCAQEALSLLPPIPDCPPSLPERGLEPCQMLLPATACGGHRRAGV